MQDDYLNRILNYIFDKRFTRALLIDGDWGSGKSYFVKNTLIPQIEGMSISKDDSTSGADTKRKDKKTYFVMMISLYGISSIESIQSAIYSACMGKMIERHGGEVPNTILKHVALFGSTIFMGIGSHYGVDKQAKKLLTQVGNGILSARKEEMVLIFDDLERCQIDVIELMGYINNLCENNGYRVIIVANENEIVKQENEIARAIQSLTAMLDLHNNDNPRDKKDESKYMTKQGRIISELNYNKNDTRTESQKRTLDTHREALFERSTLYERTREKLIGLTIRYNPCLSAVYDEVLSNAINNVSVNKFLRLKKSFVVDRFELQGHKNLRTVISFFIATGEVMKRIIDFDKRGVLSSEKVDADRIIDEERDRLLLYLIQTAINKAEGIVANKLTGVRYAIERKGVFSEEESLLRYAAIDEYWDSLTVDPSIVKEDFCRRISDCIENEIAKINDTEHYKLALFRLREWYYFSDRDVKTDLRMLREELNEKKYYPVEFKDIIYTLMCINNENFGLSIKEPNKQSSAGCIYDAVEEIVISDDEDTSSSENGDENPGYVEWEQVDINEYVKLMLGYLDNGEVTITPDMLRLFSDDLVFVKKYKGYIQPLLDWINTKELAKLQKSESCNDILGLESDRLYAFFSEHRDIYYSKRKFLSLYGYEKIEDMITKSIVKKLMIFADTIRLVYNTANLRDFFSEDYNTIYRIWVDLKTDRENGRELFNPNRERTREIALRRLEKDFSDYEEKLRDPNEVLIYRTEKRDHSC